MYNKTRGPRQCELTAVTNIDTDRRTDRRTKLTKRLELA